MNTMSNPFVQKVVPQAVKTELEKRSSKAGLQWAAKRFPWIHVTSMCKECPTKYVTLSSLKGDSLYEGLDYVRPLPVITEVSVKKLGSLGTTRKTTINITAFTDEQMVDLQKCYFIPGMGCRVEWGWSEDASGAHAPALLENRTYTDAEAVCLMAKKTETHTNYNGLQGIVANFSYNLTSENVWNCTVEVISATEAVGGTKLNEYSCPCAREYTKEGENDKKQNAKKSEFITFLKDVQESFDKAIEVYANPLIEVAAKDSKSIAINQYSYMGDPQGFLQNVAQSVLNFFHLSGKGKPIVDGYISWSALEAAINKFCIPTAKDKFTLGRIGSPNVKLTYHEYVESTDPRICILPGSHFSGKFNSTGKGFTGITPSNISIALQRADAVDHQQKAVYLDNILLNVNMLLNEADSIELSDGTISTFMMNVLRRVNEACGNLWEFVIISNDDCSSKKPLPRISIAETKKIDLIKDGGLEIPTNAIGDGLSVVREFGLDLKLADSMKTQALYSNNNTNLAVDVEGGGSCNPNSFQPFGLASGTFTNLSTPKTNKNTKTSIVPYKYPQQFDFYDLAKLTKSAQCLCQQVDANKPSQEPSFEQLIVNMLEDANDMTTSALRSELIKIYAGDAATNNGHCNNMLLPFEFKVTLDGIGGFTWGQVITSTRIPSQIRNGYNFFVTAVEHNITANDWTTTINTIARYKNDNKPNKSSRQRQEYKPEKPQPSSASPYETKDPISIGVIP